MPAGARRCTHKTRLSYHGKRSHFEDIVVEPIQKPHPPLWIGAFSPESIHRAAENGFNPLLGKNGSPEQVAECIGIYRKAVEAHDRTYDPMTVGLTCGSASRLPRRSGRRRTACACSSCAMFSDCLYRPPVVRRVSAGHGGPSTER